MRKKNKTNGVVVKEDSDGSREDGEWRQGRDSHIKDIKAVLGGDIKKKSM